MVAQMNAFLSKPEISLATPLLVVVLAFAVLAVTQFFYLDKIVIRAEVPASGPPAGALNDTVVGF